MPTIYDRESIEAMRTDDRPQVPVEVLCEYRNEDGELVERMFKRVQAKIVVDGNNPWLCTRLASRTQEFRVSWGLVCQVLNDRFPQPIRFSENIVAKYEV